MQCVIYIPVVSHCIVRFAMIFSVRIGVNKFDGFAVKQLFSQLCFSVLPVTPESLTVIVAILSVFLPYASVIPCNVVEDVTSVIMWNKV